MLPNWLYGKSLRKLQEILNSGGQTAEDVSYSNTESGLEATNAQTAIDEVVEVVEGLNTNVDVLIENGAINLLPIKCPSQTENNVTLTNNNDGSVTISGTASANTYFYLLENSMSHLEIIEGTGKSYTLSGCTSGSGSTYALRMLGSTDLVTWYTIGQIQTTEEMTFTEGAYPYYAIRLDVFSGASVNVTIKPMLVDSKYKGAYQPYAKTNKELTNDVAIKSSEITVNTTNVNSESISRNYVNKSAGIKVLVLQTRPKTDLVVGTTYELGTVPSDYLPSLSTGFIKEDVVNSTGSTALIEISSGKLKLTPRVNNLSTAYSFTISVVYV